MENISFVLSIISIFFSALFTGWSIYRDLINKGRIDLRIYVGSLIGSFNSVDNKYLTFTLTNKGQKVVFIHSVCAKPKSRKDKKSTMVIDIPDIMGLPLVPGQAVTKLISDFGICDELIEEKIKYFYVTDTIGKKHKMKKKFQNELLKACYNFGVSKNEK